jgi:hypothetical protein
VKLPDAARTLDQGSLLGVGSQLELKLGILLVAGRGEAGAQSLPLLLFHI